MHWNYRVIRTSGVYDNGQGEESWEYCQLAEVYYGEDGNITAWTEPGELSPYGDDLEELRADLGLMLQALERPVLDRRDLPDG